MQLNAWLDAFQTRLRQTRRRPAIPPSPVQVQHLEDRALLSVTTFFVAGELIANSNADDAITIRRDPTNLSNVQVLANGTIVPGASGFAASLVQSIKVNGGPGPNTINLQGVSNAAFTNLNSVLINGGDGNDTIVGSLNEDDTILGGQTRIPLVCK